MATLAIPRNPAALTPQWLTEALRRGGAGGEPTVTSFDYEPLAAGVGFLGKLGRLRLDYAGPAAGAPRSLVAKLPTEDERSRQLAIAFRFYDREVSFYRDIGPRAGMRVPALYYGDSDAATGDFVMLMEDMAPARIADQLETCTPEQVRLAIASLAQCHARWWRNPDLERFAWLPATNDPVHHFAEPAYQRCWAPFVQFVGDKLSPAMKALGERLQTRVIAMLNAVAATPATLVHGDFRADNLFFGGSDGGPAFAAVDWQISSRGRGTFDVGYLLAGSVTPEVRRTLEMDLLHDYVAQLKAGGVQGYGFDDCLRDYRLAILYCLVYAVISIGTLDPTNTRGLAMFHTLVDRVLTAIAELDAGALLPA